MELCQLHFVLATNAKRVYVEGTRLPFSPDETPRPRDVGEALLDGTIFRIQSWGPPGAWLDAGELDATGEFDRRWARGSSWVIKPLTRASRLKLPPSRISLLQRSAECRAPSS